MIRDILRAPDGEHFNFRNKDNAKRSALKWDLLCNLCELTYWKRNGGLERVKVLVKDWLKFDKMVSIDNSDSDCQLLICISRKSKLALVIFRGTTNAPDWMQNLKMKLVKSLKLLKGVETHRGSKESVESVEKSYLKVIAPLVKLDYKIGFMGHSKGGGEAVTAMLKFYDEYGRAPWLTFTIGQLRITNKAGKKLLDPIFKKVYYRGRHMWDLVTNIPLKVMSYCHFGTPIYMNWRGKLAIKEAPFHMRLFGFVSHHSTDKYINKARKFYKTGDPV